MKRRPEASRRQPALDRLKGGINGEFAAAVSGSTV
jgi:hypothetical protein